MTSFDTLYKDLLRRSFSDGKEPLPEYDAYHLDCLLHPEKYPPVLRTASCGEGDCEHACQNSCIFDRGGRLNGDRSRPVHRLRGLY